MIQFLFLSAPLNSVMANQSSSTQWSNPWWTEKQAPSGLKMPLEASQKEISKMAWCLSRCPPPTITRQSKTLNMYLPSTSQIPISYTADQHHHRRDPLSRSTTTLTLSRTTLLKWRRWVQRTGTKVDDSVVVIMQRKYQWRIQGRGPGGPALPPPSPPPPATLFLDQTEARRVEKIFWRPGPSLSKGLDAPPPHPPPSLSRALDPALNTTTERQPFMESYSKYRLSTNQPISSRPHRLLTLKLLDFWTTTNFS